MTNQKLNDLCYKSSDHNSWLRKRLGTGAEPKDSGKSHNLIDVTLKLCSNSLYFRPLGFCAYFERRIRHGSMKVSKDFQILAVS